MRTIDITFILIEKCQSNTLRFGVDGLSNKLPKQIFDVNFIWLCQNRLQKEHSNLARVKKYFTLIKFICAMRWIYFLLLERSISLFTTSEKGILLLFTIRCCAPLYSINSLFTWNVNKLICAKANKCCAAKLQMKIQEFYKKDKCSWYCFISRDNTFSQL